MTSKTLSTRRAAAGRALVPALVAALMVTSLPGMAHAYVGPGAGLTAIGTILALVGAVFFALVGFVWYPVKRMLGRGRAAPKTADSGHAVSGEGR